MDRFSSPPPRTAAAGTAAAPLVWRLEGRKAGDNAQVAAVAEALLHLRRVRVERIELDFRVHELAVNLLLGVSLAGVTADARERLAPPWPDLILTAGRRNEPVARWIQRASGMRTRLVHLGRPWADPRRFDLVLTTPQYFLDEVRYPNLCTLELPPVAASGIERGDIGGPLLLLMGGASGNRQISVTAAQAIFDASLALARARARGLRLSTSPRTSPEVERALQARAAAQGVEIYLWGQRRGDGNPYAVWLAEAGGCIVTEDSMSMAAEAASRGRPLWLARLPRRASPWWLTRSGWRWKSATHELAQRLAPMRLRRDTGRLLMNLVDGGRATWLDDPQAATFEPAPGFDEQADAQRAAAAVAALLPSWPLGKR